MWDVTCLSAEPGLKYRGEENTTTSGQVCKSWTDVEAATNMTTFFANQGTPVKISELNETLSDAENHCRNLLQLPTNAPFCFTGLALTTAEVCNISLCPTGMFNSLDQLWQNMLATPDNQSSLNKLIFKQMHM